MSASDRQPAKLQFSWTTTPKRWDVVKQTEQDVIIFLILFEGLKCCLKERLMWPAAVPHVAAIKWDLISVFIEVDQNQRYISFCLCTDSTAFRFQKEKSWRTRFQGTFFRARTDRSFMMWCNDSHPKLNIRETNELSVDYCCMSVSVQSSLRGTKTKKNSLNAFTWLAGKTDSDILTARGLHPNTHSTIPLSILINLPNARCQLYSVHFQFWATLIHHSHHSDRCVTAVTANKPRSWLQNVSLHSQDNNRCTSNKV